MSRIRVGNKWALVDDADLPKIHHHRWYPMKRSDRNITYAQAESHGHKILMHRIVLDMESSDHRRVVHINGNGLDCHLINLQIGHGERKFIGTSGFKGVTQQKRDGRWIAQINCAGKQQYIGIYDTPEEAHDAYLTTKE